MSKVRMPDVLPVVSTGAVCGLPVGVATFLPAVTNEGTVVHWMISTACEFVLVSDVFADRLADSCKNKLPLTPEITKFIEVVYMTKAITAGNSRNSLEASDG